MKVTAPPKKKKKLFKQHLCGQYRETVFANVCGASNRFSAWGQFPDINKWDREEERERERDGGCKQKDNLNDIFFLISLRKL